MLVREAGSILHMQSAKRSKNMNKVMAIDATKLRYQFLQLLGSRRPPQGPFSFILLNHPMLSLLIVFFPCAGGIKLFSFPICQNQQTNFAVLLKQTNFCTWLCLLFIYLILAWVIPNLWYSFLSFNFLKVNPINFSSTVVEAALYTELGDKRGDTKRRERKAQYLDWVVHQAWGAQGVSIRASHQAKW